MCYRSGSKLLNVIEYLFLLALFSLQFFDYLHFGSFFLLIHLPQIRVFMYVNIYVTYSTTPITYLSIMAQLLQTSKSASNWTENELSDIITINVVSLRRYSYLY